MSKAFTTNDEGTGATPLAPPLPPLPQGVTNYVTPRGLALLRAELNKARERAGMEGSHPTSDPARVQALHERVRALESRLGSAVVVATAPPARDEVRFGARVALRHGDGRQSEVQLVGVDEANPADGLVAFTSPLARAITGASRGDTVSLSTPRGQEVLTILAVDYT